MDDPRKLVLSLEQISGLIVGGRDLDSALDRIVSALSEILGARRCSILLEAEPGRLRMRAALGIPEAVVATTVVPVGEGIVGRVAQTGQARLLRGPTGEDEGPEDGYPSGSAICAPLRLRGEILGVLNISGKDAGEASDGHAFDQEDLLTAVMLAHQAAIAIDAARAVEGARERERLEQSMHVLEQRVGALEGQASALEVIRQVTDLVVAAGPLDEVLERIVHGTTTLLGAQRGSLLLLEPHSDELRMRAAVGIPADVVAQATTRLGNGIAGEVALRGEATLIKDIDEHPGERVESEESTVRYRNRSALCVPLKLRGEVIGVLNINDRTDGKSFEEDDLFVAQIIANQAAVAVANARLVSESVAAAETRRALLVAREIQLSFIPPDPRVDGFRVAARSAPCDETGGDYIDFAPSSTLMQGRSGSLFVAIGDVSGHGLGAALIMATSRAFLRALLIQSSDLAEVFAGLNRLTLGDFRRGRFMTLFAACADPGSQQLSYVSAGHDPAFLYRPETGLLCELKATGPPLGIVPDATFPTASVEFVPGDVLVLATDGVWEAVNDLGQSFGRESLSQAIRDEASAAPEQLVESIESRVRAFCGSMGQRDDISLVAVMAEELPAQPVRAPRGRARGAGSSPSSRSRSGTRRSARRPARKRGSRRARRPKGDPS